jgi:GNAT superfamily N-acetyltransferase
MTVAALSAAQADAAVTVLCEAFHDYPVMRHVLGPGRDYDRRLRTLIAFFVSARVLRAEPVLGIADNTGAMTAVALVTLPGERASPEQLAVRREAVWEELGAAERARYDAFGIASHRFTIDTPHYHLNMIGVRRSHAGRGLARQLLDAVHNLSQTDSFSCGATLSTESPRNLALYEHFGYRLLGHARVADDLQTWGFFRADTPHPSIAAGNWQATPGQPTGESAS